MLSHYSRFLQTLSLLALSSSFLIYFHSLYCTTLLPFSLLLRYFLILLHFFSIIRSFALIKTLPHHNKEKEYLRFLSVRLLSLILILTYFALLPVVFTLLPPFSENSVYHNMKFPHYSFSIRYTSILYSITSQLYIRASPIIVATVICQISTKCRIEVGFCSLFVVLSLLSST